MKEIKRIEKRLWTLFNRIKPLKTDNGEARDLIAKWKELTNWIEDETPSYL